MQKRDFSIADTVRSFVNLSCEEKGRTKICKRFVLFSQLDTLFFEKGTASSFSF